MSIPFRRRALSLASLLLTLVLTACGGGDGDGDAPPPVPRGPGALLSGHYVNTFTAADIAQAMKDPESRIEGGVTPRYAVSSYRLTYTTTGQDGAAVTASGLVSVPKKAEGAASPVISYQHATTFHDNQAPANKVEAVEPPLVLASLGYIVVSPDYVGFGASKGVEHPYLTSAPTARSVLDMLAAAETWRRQNGVADNRQLFLAGYSEGGYATMAAHRAIERQNGALKAQLQAAVPGAGPYDVLKTLDEQLGRVRALLPPLGYVLDPERLASAPENVRNEVRRLLLRQMVPENGDVRYQPLFLDRYIANQREPIAADHSVHLGWAPSVPVYLFHGRGDLTVPYQASESARDAMRAAGANGVTLTDCTTPKFGHLDCVPEYFRFAIDRMGRLARDL
ncbi:alpha/beta hydrolase family protein [Ottowia testudinis]|uniref:Prolyl oligopeptidase family serine peptidase n=1 Tax=Ottowia testudinis TaxID=2816950 RepID=A0A975H397_9BURK|nr:lipase family protein [Ottowia testudinis]QTD45604.1 prolyl oligopeptidase family serine peptidase [Ottowia testudinis]